MNGLVYGLSLNTDKTNVIHFKSNHLQDSTFQISYQGKEIKEVINKKFLGLGLDNHTKRKTDIDSIMPKLTRTCVTCTFSVTYPHSKQVTILIFIPQWSMESYSGETLQ
jgi:hypothetical protein